MKEKNILIGIDGGATKVSGWVVHRDADSGQFTLSSENVQRAYRDFSEFIPGFEPVDIKTQLAQMNGEILLTEEELRQGSVYTRCAAEVIIELLKRYDGRRALVGIGMPGLKTLDRRGIAALANGPRMPRYAADIEKHIEASGLSLQQPISHLGSDADYCGFGEEYSAEGLFAGVENAYYLGGGTGVADVLKIRSAVTAFDTVKPWMAKAWEMKGEDGLSLERYASAGGIQHIYSLKSGLSVEELNRLQIYPPVILQKALSGEGAARDTLQAVARNIAALIYERLNTLYSGWADSFTFVNPARGPLEAKHDYLGTVLDRIILGQRLGDLMEESRGSGLLWDVMTETLQSLILGHSDEAFRRAYAPAAELKPGLIQVSRLREAPAIGAAVDAWLSSNMNS